MNKSPIISAPRTKLKSAGLVSIMVTMIMMIVITLIVLGFSRISRVEQRQSLDRQLSTQAYLAAETGINDARNAFETALATTGTIPEKTVCDNVGAPAVYVSNLSPVIDGTNNISYSCLLVTSNLPDIRQGVAVDSPVTVPIHPVGSAINRLHIKWTVPGNVTTAGCPGSVQAFRASGSWPCAYGALRVDMVSTTALNRAALTASQQAFVLYPTTGGPATVNFGNPATRGAVAQMNCTSTGCNADITVAGNAASTWSMRLSAIYLPGTVQITAFNGGNQVNLKDAQVQVDSTGKAQDVLRRIQVRLALTTSGDGPGQALVSGSSICKRFGVSDTAYTNDTGIVGQDGNNPMCRP